MHSITMGWGVGLQGVLMMGTMGSTGSISVAILDKKKTVLI